MTTEPLNPSVTPLFQGRFAENTSGIIAAITTCIQAAGGVVKAYPSNTAGIIQALIDLQLAISGGGTGAQSIATLLPSLAGEVFSAGDALYVKASDGKAYKASTLFSREQANILGVAKNGAASIDDPVTIVARGPFSDYTGLVPGSEYFLDVDGGKTITPPGGGGLYSVFIGTAISSTTMDIHPLPPTLTT